MERLDFICENWVIDKYAYAQFATRITLPDFRGEDKDCWHLRTRQWRWITLRCIYPKTIPGKEYEFWFWGKFDYYSGNNTRCYIDMNETEYWDERKCHDILPYNPQAVVSSGDWVLYRFPFQSVHGGELQIQINAMEANIAIMQAFPGDEADRCVKPVKHQDKPEPFRVFNELPFQEYASLEQRVVQYFRDMLAPFHPTEDIAQESQREYYDFVMELYDRLYNEPENFFSKLYEDDAFPNRFNCAEYRKPDLKRHMNSDKDKIEELFELLHELGNTGELLMGDLCISYDLNRKQRSLLDYMGFEVTEGVLKHRKYLNIGEAVKYLADKEKARNSLMYCWFDDTYPYVTETYRKHYDKEQYERLTGWLNEHGYRISIGTNPSVTLDYYKCISKEDKPIGYAIHGDKFHYGFTFEFRPEPRVRAHCEPRIIQFGEMLLHYNELSENTKALILQRTKRCDACRYCIQTDKTGKRPLAAIKIPDEERSLCPYYPGFYYAFEKLNPLNMDGIIDFLSDMEKLLEQNVEPIHA